MKSRMIIISLGLCLVLVPACKSNSNESDPDAGIPVSGALGSMQKGDAMGTEVLVTVNDKKLTRDDAAKKVSELAQRQGVPPQMLNNFLQQEGQRMTQHIIEQFIDMTLAENEIKAREIAVTDEDVDAVIATISETLPPDMTLEEALATRNMDMAKMRSDIREGEKMRKLFEAETKDVSTATDEQIMAFYTENPRYFKQEAEASAKHILISVDQNAGDEAHAKGSEQAEAVRKKLIDGADFAAVAKEHSGCPSKERGGDLGSFGRGRMVPEFEKAAFTQEIGEIGEVVKTQFGYHVIVVTERTDATTQQLDEVSDDIRGYLTNQKKQEVFSEYMQGLRDKAEIEYAEGMQPQQQPMQRR